MESHCELKYRRLSEKYAWKQIYVGMIEWNMSEIDLQIRKTHVPNLTNKVDSLGEMELAM